MLTLKHLGTIESARSLADVSPAHLAETLRALKDAINFHGIIAGIDPSGAAFPAPTAPSTITVTSVAGGFDVSITDANPQRGVYYFVEFSVDNGFTAPRTVNLLTTRNVYLPLGQGTFFFRAYSQYRGSNISGYTVFGGATPIAVIGGAAGTPALQPTQGTGAPVSSGGSPNPPVGTGFGPVGEAIDPRNFPGARNF